MQKLSFKFSRGKLYEKLTKRVVAELLSLQTTKPAKLVQYLPVTVHNMLLLTKLSLVVTQGQNDRAPNGNLTHQQ